MRVRDGLVPTATVLALGSLLLVVISFIVLAQFSGAPPDSTYVPAHLENGRLVDGVEK